MNVSTPQESDSWLAAAFRVFANPGFNLGVSGHINARDPELVRAEKPVQGSDQQSCHPGRLTVMITGHVPAVRLPPDHADGLLAAAVPA
jgi:hypothetical protein